MPPITHACRKDTIFRKIGVVAIGKGIASVFLAAYGAITHARAKAHRRHGPKSCDCQKVPVLIARNYEKDKIEVDASAGWIFHSHANGWVADTIDDYYACECNKVAVSHHDSGWSAWSVNVVQNINWYVYTLRTEAWRKHRRETWAYK